MPGGSATAKFAVAGSPVAWKELRAPVELAFRPTVCPMTCTVKLHDVLAARLARLRLTLLVPGTAVMVPPGQDPLRPLGLATTTPAGSVSVKPTPVSGSAAFGLTMVKVRKENIPTPMVGGENVLVMVGGVVGAQLGNLTAPIRVVLPLL